MKWLLGILMAGALLLPNVVEAQWYLGAELGAGFAPGVTMIARSTDRPSICDEYINPLYASVDACQGPPGTGAGYRSIFESTIGLLGNLQLGYNFTPSFWLETEIAVWQAPYAEGVSPVSASGEQFDKLVGEILLAEEKLGTLVSVGLFLNAYYGFHDVSRGMVYYIGAGAGLNGSRVDYTSLWGREQDPDLIDTGLGEPNEEEIRQNLAGTFSYGRARFAARRVPMFQGMVGADREFSPTISIGLKLRYTIYTGYSDEHSLVWDPLRSHQPNNRLDGSEPVEGLFKTDDFSAFAVGLHIKKRF